MCYNVVLFVTVVSGSWMDFIECHVHLIFSNLIAVYGAQVLCTMESSISHVLSHCTVMNLTPAPCDAFIHCTLSLTVNWLIFNHHAHMPGRIPFICLYITSSISIPDCSTTCTVHLSECEGAEFELGIQTEMKRCKEDEAI
jgi:hypothetical protein